MSNTPLRDRLTAMLTTDELVANVVTEAQLQALVAEQVALAVVEYKAYAERYRWLRDGDTTKYGCFLAVFLSHKVAFDPLTNKETDDAIDAAIASSAQQEQKGGDE